MGLFSIRLDSKPAALEKNTLTLFRIGWVSSIGQQGYFLMVSMTGSKDYLYTSSRFTTNLKVSISRTVT